MNRPALYLIALLALGAGGCFGGCSGASDYCDFACDCNYCSDRDYDRCLDDFDYDTDRADRFGCSPEWDDYLTCIEDYGNCSGHYGCGPEWDRYQRCMN